MKDNTYNPKKIKRLGRTILGLYKTLGNAYAGMTLPQAVRKEEVVLFLWPEHFFAAMPYAFTLNFARRFVYELFLFRSLAS